MSHEYYDSEKRKQSQRNSLSIIVTAGAFLLGVFILWLTFTYIIPWEDAQEELYEPPKTEKR